MELTTDYWNFIQNLYHYILTVHFVDKKWNYQNRTISFIVILNHKGETVSKKIEEMIRGFGIRNMSTITVDNATANDIVVAYMKKKNNKYEWVDVDGGCFHMRCSTHIFKLVINKGLKDKHLL